MTDQRGKKNILSLIFMSAKNLKNIAHSFILSYLHFFIIFTFFSAYNSLQSSYIGYKYISKR